MLMFMFLQTESACRDHLRYSFSVLSLLFFVSFGFVGGLDRFFSVVVVGEVFFPRPLRPF